MSRETIKSLEINDANVDLMKLFKLMHKIKPGAAAGSLEVDRKQIAWNSAQLKKFALTDLRKPLNELEIKSMTYAIPNITYLDLSGCSLVANQYLVMAVSEFDALETFIARRSPKLNNEVIIALSQNCPYLSRIEVGGVPNDYNEYISLEAVEAMLVLKKPGLRRVRFEYCTKIGDLAVQALTGKFYSTLEELAIKRNYKKILIKQKYTCVTLRKLPKFQTFPLSTSNNAQDCRGQKQSTHASLKIKQANFSLQTLENLKYSTQVIAQSRQRQRG